MKKRTTKSPIVNLQASQLRSVIGGATATTTKKEPETYLKVELVDLVVSSYS